MNIQESEIFELSSDEIFSFECHNRIGCFNNCCRDLNQLLTPYDVVRLKKNLGLSSTHFLEKYTQRYTGPQTGLPVISLKPKEDITRQCPFVTSSGCSVYHDRPSSCRMYPLIRSVSRSRQSGRVTEKYMLIKEAHCQGFQCSMPRTIKEWISDQKLRAFNVMNDAVLELISAKNRLMPGKMDEDMENVFYSACYDIDGFRDRVFGKRKSIMGLDEMDIPDSAMNDDVEMLKFSMAFVMRSIFGQSKWRLF